MQQYNITGMSCAACSARVEKAVSAVAGVSECSVSLLTNSMGVEGSASPQEIIQAVQKAGYGASLKTAANAKNAAAAPADELDDHETPKLKKRLFWSLGFLLVLMYVSMGHSMWGWPLPAFLEGNFIAIALVQLLLAVIVMVINQKFFVSGFTALWHRAPNMDTLVALGSAAAFIYSLYALFMMTGNAASAATWAGELYFETAAMILTLITVGKTLEAHSKGKTTDALKSLMKLAPQTATLRRNGAEVTVPVEQVVQGDVFLVRPGENVPVDGVVIEGGGAVNEAALTGESIPVDKSVGDAVSAATVNQSGVLVCRATRVGEDTTLSQIIRMVSDAAATKAPIARVADKVSGVFVPVVMVLALITAVVWLILGRGAGFALARGISVLVISCPCALGLATPVAIMVGNGKGARNGILFKTSAALEKAGKTQIVVLDKTGTVTQGEPRVTDVLPTDGVDRMELLRAAASLERYSEHPLARAVMDYAQQEHIEPQHVTEFEALAGNGLTAVQNGETLRGGSLRYMSDVLVVPATLVSACDALSEQGKTPLLFARGERLLGVIAVADVIRPDSPAAIRELRGMGIRVVMLTGDNERTANAIGREAGVDEVVAGVLPDGKAEVINRLKAQGAVAMVGDGINDAPALTSADTGIAIGAGTDVAIDAADVVLMKSRLRDVPAAIRLSRATLRNIHQNLFWAFIYNAIGIPIAAGVFIPLGLTLNPMLGAAAMSLSSFCVVTNALRLNLAKIYEKTEETAMDIEVKPTTEANTVEVTVRGMMCAHCEARVVQVLSALSGVASVTADHDADKVTIEYTILPEESAVKAAVEGAGYTFISMKK